MEHIAIIGNGISGITAARHIRKLSDKKITVISAESKYFFSRTALMYIYMGHMTFKHTQPYEDWFWKKNKIDLKHGFVSSIDTDRKKLIFEDGEKLIYDKLIIATGSKPNKFGWPGQDLKGVQGLYTKQDLENLEQWAPNNSICNRGVIVGGGLIGIELAEMLRTRNIPVTFLVREPNFWSNVLPEPEAKMINKHIIEHGVDLRLAVNLQEIRSDNQQRVKSVVVKETGEEIQCNFVGLTAGVSPNIDVIRTTSIETGKGVKVNKYLETNIEDIYAIGDCAEQQEPVGGRRPVEAVWYTGRMMGEVVAQTICGNKTAYKPSHWFNSAKFFDIEYQTYGWVYPQPEAGHKHFHWSHPDGRKCITIEYVSQSGEVKGINSLGIRMKHEVFDRWLTEKRDIEYILDHLRQANFDPEFYDHYELDIIKSYKKESIPIIEKTD